MVPPIKAWTGLWILCKNLSSFTDIPGLSNFLDFNKLYYTNSPSAYKAFLADKIPRLAGYYAVTDNAEHRKLFVYISLSYKI